MEGKDVNGVEVEKLTGLMLYRNDDGAQVELTFDNEEDPYNPVNPKRFKFEVSEQLGNMLWEARARLKL